jgi:NAD(P)-dependent dehydrogenase (short-subunit alcohol dehydrogenase family)
VLAGRNLQSLQETADLAAGASMLPVKTDVTQADSVAQLFQRAVDAFGRVDLLFNNAGTTAPPALFEDITVEQWQSVVAVNLTGAFLVAQAAYRVMKDQTPQGGRIINNGSISAHVPRPNSAPYTATKHAMTGLTKCLSLDGRKYNIACGQIDIGNATTDMVKVISRGVPQANGSLLAEPTMSVDHVGDAIAHMADLPLETNVQFMTIMASAMPYIGRG